MTAIAEPRPVGEAAPDTGAAPALAPDPLWYKRAVFYEVLVHAFSDSDGDGVGDLPGLTAKLDYLAWLGVDCLWLPPFAASTLRDGAADLGDFCTVLPAFGTVADVVRLVDEAHRRGIRVVTDVVTSRTSDGHPWFRESRRDPHGPYGDFYLWSDTDPGSADGAPAAGSGWSYDPVRRQFYRHRLAGRQPELHYGNPAVHEAMLDVARFWLDLGIDGLRLDAAPGAGRPGGAAGPGPVDAHTFLARMRRVVDEEYPGRVLLTEAGRCPAEAVGCFGGPATGGAECHLAFHSALIPRIFLAVRRESRFPVAATLARTADIPADCQWGIYLRNHDDLCLDTVGEDERAYLCTEYAPEPRMRAGSGIRRRLAPLLDNDRRTIELVTALLLSLPGSPVLYYGDEIGMGDNIWLSGRDAVRTPMQWTPDRNAGFSRCDPNRVYPPVVSDPVYGSATVNVETQAANESSLLRWTRRMLLVRRSQPAFGSGEYVDLDPDNPSVLTFLRRDVADGAPRVVLCVNNLSAAPQAVELDLAGYAGAVPVELTGGVRFPRIGTLPYLLTLPGHAFYWFGLDALGEG